MESFQDIEILIKSGRNLIVIETDQESSFLAGFKRMAVHSERAYFQWTVTQGLLRLSQGFEPQVVNKDVGQLFGQILSTQRAGVYVLIDFHHFLKEPVTIRYLKDVLLQAPQHAVVLLSPSIDLPAELRTLATFYSDPLPTPSELKQMVGDLALSWQEQQGNSLKLESKRIVRDLVKTLNGVARNDALRMARHAIWNDGVIDRNDLNDIAQDKFTLLNHNNVLRLELDFENLNDIAGFNALKQWLAVRKDVFLGSVALPGGDIPKGMLLLGVQGCGKSMAAKAVAGSWQLPLLHLDFGTLYNRFYGQTEENLRTALDIAEKMQPCVLWLDELEKGLSAVSGNDDTSKRLLGTFLTWMAEKKSSVFVVGTANDVSVLPPELIRKGRFDEVFFVDLPSRVERAQILSLHLSRREQDLSAIDLEQLADHTDGFSGAELEQIVVSAMYQQYAQSNLLSTAALMTEIKGTRPLSVLMAEKVAALREWAVGRAVAV